MRGYPPADVGNDESIAAFFAAAKEKFGAIDFLVHSLAFADYNYLKTEAGVFTSTPREVFKQALDISAYSLIALTRAAEPLMSAGGSVIAMTYLGSEKVVPGYNIMGVAKAALESSARYLAFDLGAKKIRVNTISAGPIKTLAASVVGDLDDMLAHSARKSPLKRNIDATEVAKTAVYLLSDLASGVTGENIYVTRASIPSACRPIWPRGAGVRTGVPNSNAKMKASCPWRRPLRNSYHRQT